LHNQNICILFLAIEVEAGSEFLSPIDIYHTVLFHQAI
jgi:hypothetical protein